MGLFYKQVRHLLPPLPHRPPVPGGGLLHHGGLHLPGDYSDDDDDNDSDDDDDNDAGPGAGPAQLRTLGERGRGGRGLDARRGRDQLRHQQQRALVGGGG